MQKTSKMLESVGSGFGQVNLIHFAIINYGTMNNIGTCVCVCVCVSVCVCVCACVCDQQNAENSRLRGGSCGKSVFVCVCVSV